ncbi:MAG: hypothetical protein JJT78_13235 [Leptospira sp.]|nr:hypothetical protein [Leptospira sp.]
MTKNILISLTFFSIILSNSLLADSSLKVRLVNGTSQGIGKVDTLRVILLKEAMLPIRELKNLQGSFTIEKLDLPDGIPVLLQATYKGANYNKMIPPVPEMRKQEIVIEIFESGNDSKIIQTRSLLQMVKAPDHLQVFKIYIIQNKSNPPRSYSSPQGLDFYIPTNAKELRGTWTQGTSKMGIPMEFKDKSDTLKNVERSVLPGNTEVQISYTIPWTENSITFTDALLFEDSDNSKQRPVFLKPQDMKLTVSSDSNPTELTDEIPEGLKAYMVRYDKGTKQATFKLEGGKPVVPKFAQQSREIVNGDLIPEWDTALVAVIGILALLFSIQYASEYIVKIRRK